MLTMTYRVWKPEDNAEATGLFVHVASYCEGQHAWSIPVPTAARLTPKSNRPKAFYRYAENVLLSTGRVVFAQTEAERKAGIPGKKRVLACKECLEAEDAGAE
jgi:5-methylcytosine-specific restriction endonuclease McrA